MKMINIFGLAISIALFAHSAESSSKDCLSLVGSLINDRPSNSSDSHYQTNPIKNKINKKVWKMAKAEGLSAPEAQTLANNLQNIKKNELDVELLKSYIKFLGTLKEEEKKQALLEAPNIFRPYLSKPSKIIKRFKKLKKHVDKKQNKIFLKQLTELKSNHPGKSHYSLEKMAKKSSLQSRVDYERLAFSCTSKNHTSEKKEAAKLFSKFVVGIGLTSSIASYSYVNYDKEINGTWFGKLGYELAIGIISNYLSAKILTNPNNSILKMGVQKYTLARSFGIVDMGLYSLLFGGNQDEAKEKLQTMIESDESREEIGKLLKFINEEKTLVKYKQAVIENIKSLFKNGSLSLEGGQSIDINKFNLNDLTLEDLNDPQVQDILITAILSKEYEENQGELITTGDIGADRFVFHAAYGFIMMPKDIFTSLYIYKVLCLGQMNPKVALMKAVALYTLNRLVFDQVYYYSRRESINQ